MNRTDTARRKPVPLDPEPPLTRMDAIVCAYILIFVTGGGMLFLNIYGDRNVGLKIALAIIIGGFPPFISTFVAHITAAVGSGKWFVYGIIIASMGVSAANVTLTLCPPLEPYLVAPLAIAADGASIYCLSVLINAEVKRAAHRKWSALKDAAAEAAQGSGNHESYAPAGSRTPDQASAGTGGSGSQNQDPAVLGTTAGTTGTSPQNHSSGDAGNQPPASPAQPPPGPSGPGFDVNGATLAFRRAAFVAEWAARPRPPIDSLEHQQQHARRFLDDFRHAFKGDGIEASWAELGKALGMSKAKAGDLKNSLPGQSRRTA